LGMSIGSRYTDEGSNLVFEYRRHREFCFMSRETHNVLLLCAAICLDYSRLRCGDGIRMRWAAIRPDRNAMGGNRAGTCPILRFSHLAFPYSSPVATVWIFQCKIHEYYHNVYKYTVGRAGGRQIRWGNIRMCGGGGVGGGEWECGRGGQHSLIPHPPLWGLHRNLSTSSIVLWLPPLLLVTSFVDIAIMKQMLHHIQ
jgi:hypothetical protein